MVRLDLRKLSGEQVKPFLRLTDEAELPADGAVLVSLARLERDADALAARGAPFGVVVPGDTPASALAPWLDRLAAVAIEIPKFSDGRVFSLAHRLRDEFGYRGEIRALGHVLADHAEFLRRSGVDSIEVESETVAHNARRRLQMYGLWYQDALDARPTVLELRHGRTRRRLAS